MLMVLCLSSLSYASSRGGHRSASPFSRGSASLPHYRAQAPARRSTRPPQGGAQAPHDSGTLTLPRVRRTRGRRTGAWSRGRRSAEEGPQLVGDLTAKAAVAVGGPMRPSRVASPSHATGPLLHLVGRPVSRGCDRAGARARDTATSAGPGSFGAGRGGGKGREHLSVAGNADQEWGAYTFFPWQP